MIPVLNRRFECAGCGKCCTNLRKAFYNTAKNEEIVFSLTDSPGLPLWEWEARRLKVLARKKGREATIEPLHFLHDTISGRSVVISFHLNHSSCIFHEPGRCTIYQKRPFACAMFPVIRSGVFDFSSEKKAVNLQKSICPGDNGGEVVYGRMSSAEYTTRMRQYYGDNFDVSVQNDLVNYFIVKKIRQMVEDGLIDPLVSPKSSALDAFGGSEKITFFGLLSENGENTEDLADDLASLMQSRKMIDAILEGG